jgi:multidrug efflux pump subunit AcrA (membrane-fusion protein)
VRASGHLRLPVQQWLYFDKAGSIKEILVNKGDRVTRGQVVARLDDTDAQAAVKQAENALKQQELALGLAEQAAQTARLDLAFSRQRLEESFPPTGDTIYTYYTDVPAMRTDVVKSQELVKSALEALASGRNQEAAASLRAAGVLLQTVYNSSLATQFIALGKTSTLTQSISSLRQLEYNIQRAQAAVENAALAVEQARAGITGARLLITHAGSWPAPTLPPPSTAWFPMFPCVPATGWGPPPMPPARSCGWWIPPSWRWKATWMNLTGRA